MDRVKEIITLNKKGMKVEQLTEEISHKLKESHADLEFVHSEPSEDINRFNKPEKNNIRRKKKNRQH